MDSVIHDKQLLTIINLNESVWTTWNGERAEIRFKVENAANRGYYYAKNIFSKNI